MNIRIDENFKLTSDDRNVILSEVKVSQEGKNVGREYDSIIGYYGTVEHAIKDYKRLKKNRSDATSVNQLIEVCKEIDRKIDNMIGGGIQEKAFEEDLFKKVSNEITEDEETRQIIIDEALEKYRKAKI